MIRPRRRWLLYGTLAVAVVALITAFGRGLGRDPTAVPSALIQRPAPPLAGPTLDGGHLDLRDYRGKWVLVNVWASWCDACREEHPELLAASRNLRDEGLRVIGINMKDSKEDARRFVTNMGGSYGPSVLDPEAKIAVRWGTFAIPETYLVSPKGIIIDKRVGAMTSAWIRNNVVPRLENTP